MTIDRRRFTGLLAGALGGLTLPRVREPAPGPCDPLPKTVAALKPMTGDVHPIDATERAARREHARRLMHEQGFGAIVLEPGRA